VETNPRASHEVIRFVFNEILRHRAPFIFFSQLVKVEIRFEELLVKREFLVVLYQEANYVAFGKQAAPLAQTIESMLALLLA
jgi:hypothetical protein